MPKPLLLDLFCGAGGAGEGYARAGFRVVGVDLDAKPLRHNPHETYQGDALEVLGTLLAGEPFHGYQLHDFAAIHTSPPCQEYSATKAFRLVSGITHEHPMLVGECYRLLRHTGLPFVIENVVGAPMPDALQLCGSMFGLQVIRHRWFACSQLLWAPGSCRHASGSYNVIGGKVRGYGSFASGKTYGCGDGSRRQRESYPPKAVGQAAMGIDWMTVPEMSQAIPPAYTQWIGRQLLPVVMGVSA
jgi:DNA (cytosine-5)-methyltransferase 1